MTRAIGRALAAALVGALAGAAWVTVFYVRHPSLVMEFDTDAPRTVSGIYPSERADEGRATFAWTGGDVAIRLPGLDRSQPWRLTLRVRGARQDDAQNPVLSFFADGLLVTTHRTSTDYEEVGVVAPARPGRPGLLLSFQASPTFSPGGRDPRALGVMLDRITVAPEGLVLPPKPALVGAAVAAAAMGAGAALLGVIPATALGAAVVIAAGPASLIARGFGPYTRYPDTVAITALWVAAGLVAIALVLARVGRPLRNTARFVMIFSAAAFLLKLLALLHPGMPIGDALFHAHRFQDVLRGHYYFTSIAPGNYLFPYPPGLYVVARPFAALVSRNAGDMVLLRTIVLIADTLAGALLYFTVVRTGGNRLTGAIAVAIYQLVPLDFRVVTTGNLTNAFAQSLSVFGFSLFALTPVVPRPRTVAVVLALVLAVAFMSHTSTFAILSCASVAIAVLYWWSGSTSRPSPALSVFVAFAVAAVLAVAVYYAHFGETYRTELTRIGSETAQGAADAGGRGIGERWRTVPYYLNLSIGIPIMLLALYGSAHWWRRRASDPLAVTTAGWTVACLMFLALGILTPVDMRYYLAAIPALAIASAVGASALWTIHPAGRLAATLLLTWSAWIGVASWSSAF